MESPQPGKFLKFCNPNPSWQRCPTMRLKTSAESTRSALSNSWPSPCSEAYLRAYSTLLLLQSDGSSSDFLSLLRAWRSSKYQRKRQDDGKMKEETPHSPCHSSFCDLSGLSEFLFQHTDMYCSHARKINSLSRYYVMIFMFWHEHFHFHISTWFIETWSFSRRLSAN